jgi:hypothetical protein
MENVNQKRVLFYNFSLSPFLSLEGEEFYPDA